MYFKSLYLRGVRSSQTETCCLPSIFLTFCLLVRNSFLFLYDTNFAMIGLEFSLFLLFCRSRCILYRSISHVSNRVARGPNAASHVFLCGPRSLNFKPQPAYFFGTVVVLYLFTNMKGWSLPCYNFAILVIFADLTCLFKKSYSVSRLLSLQHNHYYVTETLFQH